MQFNSSRTYQKHPQKTKKQNNTQKTTTPPSPTNNQWFGILEKNFPKHPKLLSMFSGEAWVQH